MTLFLSKEIQTERPHAIQAAADMQFTRTRTTTNGLTQIINDLPSCIST